MAHTIESGDSTSPAIKRLGLKCFLLFIGVFILYWKTRSEWLDEWDSVQFALGIQHFNLFLHQPHPPGYPLYIFLGWLGVNGLFLDPQRALMLTSCMGAGIFVTCWFLMFARRFGEGLAWFAAVTVAIMPMNWMTGTKVLTDVPAAACLAVELALLAVGPGQRLAMIRILFAAAAGAFAAGLRPQNSGFAILILVVGLWHARATRREWLAGIGVWLVGCACWLLPTMWTQANLPKGRGDWMTYPRLLLHQWGWRLDKPDVYLGAGDLSPLYLIKRIYRHTIKVWLLWGFAWQTKALLSGVGLALYAGGVLIYLRKRLYRQANHRAFWRFNLPWVGAYFIMVFITLPPDPRYYCPISPLLALPPLAGWWSLQGRARWWALALPLVVLMTALPLVKANHREPTPPIRMIEYLDDKYSRRKQAQVWLFLTDSERHGQWYASNFRRSRPQSIPFPQEVLTQRARAMYTDDKRFLEKSKWTNVKLKRIREFKRSPLIYSKHAKVTLYQIVPVEAAPEETPR